MEISPTTQGLYGLGSAGGYRLQEGSAAQLQARQSLPRVPSELQPRLLDLLAVRPERLPLTCPVGVGEQGPLWISLESPKSAHWIVADVPGPSRSDFVRSMAIGLAITTRPSLLQIVLIDLSGNELRPLESLPHAAVETASDPLAARLSLRWLAAEFQTRCVEKRTWPRMLLVVDSLSSLGTAAPRSLLEVLTVFLGCGAPLGIHVLAGVDRSSQRHLAGAGHPVAAMEGGGIPGRYELVGLGVRRPFLAATLSAIDLDRAVRGAATPPRSLADHRDPRGGAIQALRHPPGGGA